MCVYALDCNSRSKTVISGHNSFLCVIPEFASFVQCIDDIFTFLKTKLDVC